MLLIDFIKLINTTDRNCLKIYNEGGGYKICEPSSGESCHIRYVEKRKAFYIIIRDCSNSCILAEYIKINSVECKYIRELDISLNLNLYQWDW